METLLSRLRILPSKGPSLNRQLTLEYQVSGVGLRYKGGTTMIIIWNARKSYSQESNLIFTFFDRAITPKLLDGLN